MHRVSRIAAACGAVAVLFAAGSASAQQTCERTRAEVRIECIAFMKTHRWDEASGRYVNR